MYLISLQQYSFIRGGSDYSSSFLVNLPIVSSGIGSAIGSSLGGASGSTIGATVGVGVGTLLKESSRELVDQISDYIYSDEVKSAMIATDYLLQYLF